MGANQSSGPRTVNIENKHPIGVIDVSDDVVNRLKNGLNKGDQGSSKSTSTQTTASAAPQKETAPVASPAPTPAKKPAPATPPKQTFINPYPAPPVSSRPSGLYTEPSLTAIEVRREKEIELQQNDAYWRQRLVQLEQTLNKTNDIMEKEYSAAVEDVRARFTNAPPTHQLPPCQELKAQLIACYRANPGETLKCSEQVAAFTNCVSENRVKKLDATVAKDSTAPASSVAVKAKAA